MRVRGDIDFLRSSVSIDGIPLSSGGPLLPSANYPATPRFSSQPATSRAGSAGSGLSARHQITVGALIPDTGISKQGGGGGVGPTGTPAAPSRPAAVAP